MSLSDSGRSDPSAHGSSAGAGAGVGDRPVTERLFTYVDASPSPYHAAANAAALLDAARFAEVEIDGDWADASNRAYVRVGGALVAWCHDSPASTAIEFRMVGAHTDSPNLRIKPQPDSGNVGYQQLGVEVYGGPLLNSWLDRDLGISGRAVVRDSAGERTELFAINEPLMRVAQLAIHLDRDVNDGLKLDRQRHLSPMWGLGPATPDLFQEWLAGEIGVGASEVVAVDAMVHDLTPCGLIGRDGSMYAAPRIDNLASCHAAIEALAASSEDRDSAAVSVAVLFDHEEIGSDSSTGAGSPLLANTLERISSALGASRDEHLRAIARSWCVSADGAHAVHPNYPERHEPQHMVQLNAGPVVKRNANVRYASDAETVARFAAACTEASVPMQQYAHRTDMACGSTIGPITAANLGVRVVDVGSAQLSMHSARELGGADDPGYLTAALAAFYAGA